MADENRFGIGLKRPEVTKQAQLQQGEERLSLKVISGDDIFPIRHLILPATIGRPTGSSGLCPSSSNALFSSTLLSRKHASIYAEGKAIWVTDMGSSNGTYLNGILLKSHMPYRIGDGDLLQFGADDEASGLEGGHRPLVLQVKMASVGLTSSSSTFSTSSISMPEEMPRRTMFSPGRILQEARSLLSKSNTRFASGSMGEVFTGTSVTSSFWTPSPAQKAQELSSGLIALAQKLVETAETAKMDVVPRPEALYDLHKSVECALQIHANRRQRPYNQGVAATFYQRPNLPDALKIISRYETVFCILALLFIAHLFL